VNGARLPAAVTRASQKFDASERTIQRTWAAREVISNEIRDPDFDTVLQEEISDP
jgi:hypothetical protein